MPKFFIKTFGCKVNQCDSDALKDAIVARGWQQTQDASAADCFVVNTCTVTSVSDAKVKKFIRAIKRSRPDATVVALGCLVKRNPTALADADVVLQNSDIEKWLDTLSVHDPASPPERTRTRGFIKVQDGCDSNCAYCIVPSVRGKPRSVPLAELLRQAQKLESEGVNEIVLCGIHLGLYGTDMERDRYAALPELLKELLQNTGIPRFRLSSIEVNEVTDDILAAFKSSPRLCRHLHIPLQSGDDGVLRRMNRRYTVQDFRETIERIRSVDPNFALTSDVMVGFPGESTEQFLRSCQIVEEFRFSRLHVFRYSTRTETPAASLPDQVDESTKKQRADVMISLGGRLAAEYRATHVGRALEVLVEKCAPPTGGWAEGLSSSYLRVRFPCREACEPNSLVVVRVERVDDDALIGRIVEEPRYR